MSEFAIVPQPAHAGGFVELSRSKQGHVFEKHILNYGDLLYPGVAGGKVHIDDAFADTLISNFKNGVCDIVQAPVAGDHNEHTEDPLRNVGEVIGLVKRDKKIYAQIDVRDEVAASRMGKTLLGASALMHLNYKDTRTGKTAGPTLLHVAITNRPYVVGLDDFTELIAASRSGADGTDEAVVLTASNTEGMKMDLADLKAELKADHGIDVDALVASAGLVDSAVTLTNSVRDALVAGEFIALTAGVEPTADDLVKAINDAHEKIVSLTASVAEADEKAKKTDAESHVDELVRTGHILPANRDAQVTLLLTNPDLFDALLPEQPLVKLSNESGTDLGAEGGQGDVQSEVDRISDKYLK